MHWISVNDGMPEPNLEVLAAWSNGDETFIAPSYWDKKNQQWRDFLGRFSARWGNFWVYAWTPYNPAPRS